MRGEIDQNRRRLWLKEIETELVSLLTAANRLRSMAPEDVQFRETYGIATLKRQVQFQASAWYGKLVDRTEIKPDLDLPQFVHLFTEGTIVQRFRTGTALGNLIKEEIKSLG